MEAAFWYLGKLIVCSGVTYLYYKLSLKDKTFHHYNRFYLLGSVLISIFLPLLKIEYFTIQVNENWFNVLNKFQNINTTNTTENDFSYSRILFAMLGLVTIFLVGKLLHSIFKILQLKNQFSPQNFEGITFYETNLHDAPFSFFRNLFWKNSIQVNSDLGRQILKHEMVHIEQKHSFDKVFVELSTAVFWFNPFFYLIKKELYLIHEYLADKKAVKHSDTKAFAQMLLASHFGGNQFAVTSPFLSSNLKKRLQMLQKPKTKYSYTRRLLALPILFTIGFAYLVNAENKKIKEELQVVLNSKDTLSPKKTVTAELVNSSSVDLLETELEKANNDDIFLVDGKVVSKYEFSKVFNKKADGYYFVHSVNNGNPEMSVFSAEKFNDEDAKKVRESYFKSEIMNGNVAYTQAMKDAKHAEIDARHAEEDGRQAVLDAQMAERDAQQAQRDHKQAIKDAKQAVKDAKVAERLAKEAARSSKYAFQDSEKARKESSKFYISAEKVRIESDKIRAEASDLSKINATERSNLSKTSKLQIVTGEHRNTNYVKEPKDPREPIYKSEKFRYGVSTGYKSTEDYEVYVNGKKSEKDVLKAIDPKTIKSINVIKATQPARLEVELK